MSRTQIVVTVARKVRVDLHDAEVEHIYCVSRRPG